MNVFYTDPEPVICALHHCDLHRRKMIIEYSQMLCTAHRDLNPELKEYYDEMGLMKSTHKNHPSAAWVRQSAKHYRWLYRTLKHLHRCYTHSRGRVHKSARVMTFLDRYPIGIPNAGFTPPPTCYKQRRLSGYR